MHEQDYLEQFNEWLDEAYDDYEIMGMHYSPSRILAELDPTAHRVEFLNWCDDKGIDLDDL